MREYLFRGKTLNGDEWVEGSLISVDTETDGTLAYIFPDAGRSRSVDPETVGQWTDLPDKNDKKIFEGDVLYNGIGAPVVVDYLPGLFTVVYPGGSQRLLNDYYESGVTEVIGNIHDNPEFREKLLKGE